MESWISKPVPSVNLAAGVENRSDRMRIGLQKRDVASILQHDSAKREVSFS